METAQQESQKKDIDEDKQQEQVQQEHKQEQNHEDQKEQEKVLTKFEQLQLQVDEETKHKWEVEQNQLKEQLILEDELDFNPDDPKDLKYIAAVDISYSKKDFQKGVAALVVCDYPGFNTVYEDYVIEETEYPYIPGFLAFKEVPSYRKLFENLQMNKPEIKPQILLVDGNGILHNRGFGCASHVGVVSSFPTIGVGKTVFAVDGITQIGVKQLCEKELQKGGDKVDLVGDSGKIWGCAYRSTDASKNPLIVSQGHKISLLSALKVVQMCVKKFRIPEPIRKADGNSRTYVRQFYDQVDNQQKKSKKGK